MLSKLTFLVSVTLALTTFSTSAQAKASAPDPPDGGSAGADVVLGWTAAAAAVSHDVYLGTDFDDVNSATPASPQWQCNIIMPNTSYNPPVMLALSETYYWRIDEHDGIGNVVKGDIWSFTTVNYLVVDDMEAYSLVNLIHLTWLDWRWNNTGATITRGIAPGSPVHGGTQSMIYNYDNSVNWGSGYYYSETEADTADLQAGSDWTTSGVRALSLWFYGTVGNAAGPTEQMYLVLEDAFGSVAAIPYDGPMADVAIPVWQEWNIVLQDFSNLGVNLVNVSKVYIDFGDRNNATVPGGAGVVYFDDFRLYLPRCRPAIIKPPADFNGDCIVYYEDLRIMAQEWLTPGINADLVNDGNVDFKDYAVMMNQWLYQLSWP